MTSVNTILTYKRDVDKVWFSRQTTDHMSIKGYGDQNKSLLIS
jgi:hypothetical protein